MAKVDLHIHSKYSDRSAEWVARRMGLPDSFSEPSEIYATLKARGMTYVTITDHNSIDGCLEIVDRPGTFISEQVTTYFPEDRARAHLLVWGINETQHREMAGLRENIYDLQRYIAAENLAHAVAHPLFRSNEQLESVHFEKLLLLFKCFEGINGHRDAMLGEVAQFVFARLTPEKMEALANQHNISPTHAEPWKKYLIAGSDDHSGIFPASAYTEASKVKSAAEFLEQIKQGRCSMHGKGGTPLALSHGLYNTMASFIRGKFMRGNKLGYGFIEKAFSRFMEGQDPTEFTLAEKIGFLAQGIASGKIFELVKPANASLWKQFASYFKRTDVKELLAKETEGIEEPERRAFLMANFFANHLAFRFFTKFIKDLASGDVIESMQQASTMIPILLTLSPYIYTFKSQSPPRKWLRGLCESMGTGIPPALQNQKRAWFTDTLEDVNGVATTIRKMTASGMAAGHDLIVVTSRPEIQITDIPIKNFTPIGEFELPEYELQKLSFPPILQMMDYIQREKFTELIISTPGPVGITALIAAKTLGLRTSGIYHTDFPQYVRILTDDSFLETLTWNYMHWFYSQIDLLYVNSEYYRNCWVDRGIAPDKIKILPRGLDTAHYHPSKRNNKLRKTFGAQADEVVLLYVGRISKEKDLDLLASAYHQLQRKKMGVKLVLVGDGPYLKTLKKAIPTAHFTGYLQGDELAEVFASADIFAFPSTTDTFGNVVLEAMASGLPCVVSDTGGPRELVQEGETGFVTRSLDLESFTTAIQRLVEDPGLRSILSRKARQSVEERSWSGAFQKFWGMSES